jgi:four helix bundle protein
MEYKKINSYKDLIVWQKSIQLVIEIYNITDQFPKAELYGLTSQIRRAAVSIPANISEGSRRGTIKEYRQFLKISFGSGSELETLVEIVKNLPFSKNISFEKIDILLGEIMKMLNSLLSKLALYKTTTYPLQTTT